MLQVPRNKGDLLTNFQAGVEADEIQVSRAMSPCDCNLDRYLGKTIAVVGVVMNMTEFESTEVAGEFEDRIYASIILADGTIVGTTGKAVMGQLGYIIGTRLPGPFDPPIEFEVREHKSPPPKRPYYSLRRVAALPKSTKKGV